MAWLGSISAKLPAQELRGSRAPHSRNDAMISDLAIIIITSLSTKLSRFHNMLRIFSFLFSQSAWEYAAPYTEAILPHATVTLPATLPKYPLFYVALLFTAISAIWYLLQSGNKSPRNRSQIVSQPSSGLHTVNSSSRPPGVWIPVEFQRPAASPYLDWDINTTEPLPYRPFKFGPGHITMGIRAMKWDEWIELDNHYMEWQTTKAKRIQERGDKCCKTAPEAYDAAIELLEEL